MNKIKLKDISSKIGSGATPRGGKNSYKKTGISLIRSMNVYDYHFLYNELAHIDEKQAKQLDNVEVNKNDILLNITGASVGRCCMVPDDVLPARVNQHVSIIRIDPKRANSFYVLYYLNNYDNKIQLMNLSYGGATREALTKEKIENFHIEIPSLETQEKISLFLLNLDKLVANNSKRIENLEEIARVAYEEWFVENQPNDWKTEKLNKYVDFVRGIEPGSNSYINENGEGLIQFLRVGDIGSRNSELFIKTELAKGKILKEDDIVVSLDGTVGIVKIGMVGCYSTGIRKLKILNNYISKAFLYCLMKSEDIQKSIKANARGTTIMHAGSAVDKMVFTLPPQDVMDEFTEIVEPMIKEILILNKKNKNLISTRDLLLPKLMSGEIEL